MAAAGQRRPPAELPLIQRLLADIRERGHHHGWGKAVTPGVSGWYTVAGHPSAVWNLNLGGETPAGRAYMYFYLGDLAKRLPTERIERTARILQQIPALKPKIAEARAQQWNKYPSVYLEEIASSHDAIDTIFVAIDDLTAPE